jgi:hypothetical protein
MESSACQLIEPYRNRIRDSASLARSALAGVQQRNDFFQTPDVTGNACFQQSSMIDADEAIC